DHGLRVGLIQELRLVLHETHKPAIYVTHDREEAFALADRLLILHDGMILQEGSSEELFVRPASAWIANFLGLGNLIVGEIVSLEPLLVQTALGVLEAGSGQDDFQAGQPCRLLLRPQDALVVDGQPSMPNLIQMGLRDCIFMGEYYRLDLAAAGMDLQAHSKVAFAPGEVLKVAFLPEKVLCLAERDGKA
ncbi:MAG: hypothetical protein WA110_10055, partial [Anaerolineaceae bacterium]